MRIIRLVFSSDICMFPGPEIKTQRKQYLDGKLKDKGGKRFMDVVELVGEETPVLKEQRTTLGNVSNRLGRDSPHPRKVTTHKAAVPV